MKLCEATASFHSKEISRRGFEGTVRWKGTSSRDVFIVSTSHIEITGTSNSQRSAAREGSIPVIARVAALPGSGPNGGGLDSGKGSCKGSFKDYWKASCLIVGIGNILMRGRTPTAMLRFCK